MREVEKFSSTGGFEPGILALIANMLNNVAEMTGKVSRSNKKESGQIVTGCCTGAVLAN